MRAVVSAATHTDSEGGHCPKDTLLVEAETHKAVGLLLPSPILELVLMKLHSEKADFSMKIRSQKNL
jgi:hypothetical protein